MPPVLDSRRVSRTNSSSNTSLSCEETPPDAFHASAFLTRRYPRDQGVPLESMASATSGKKPAQSRFTNAAGGRQNLPLSAQSAGSLSRGLSSSATGAAEGAAEASAVGAGGAAAGGAPPHETARSGATARASERRNLNEVRTMAAKRRGGPA